MNRETQTAPPKSSRLGVTILFLILFIIIAFFVWRWADRRGDIVEIQRTVAEYLVNVDFFGKRPRQLLAEVRDTTEETRRQVNKLKKDDVASQNQQESIDKLSNLIERIDDLPLAMDTQLVKVNFPMDQFVSPQEHRWYKLINEIWQDLQQIVTIEKLDNPGIELLSPSQRDLLRENIKLRLLLAQYSLLSHDQNSFQENLESAINLINQHYDKEAESVIELLNELEQLPDYTIGEVSSRDSKRFNTVRNYQLILDEEGQ